MKRRVVVTGCGAISALGPDRATLAESLLAARSGIIMQRVPLANGGHHPIPVAAVAPDAELLAVYRRAELELLDRVTRLALIAAAQAIDESRLAIDPDARRGAGVFVGTSMGGAASAERAYMDMLGLGIDPRPFTVLSVMHNAPAGHIAIRHGFTGPNLTYSAACASSSHAIGEAFHAVRAGEIRCAVAGGAESCLVPGVLRAWKALRILASPDATDPARSCRPFSADRAGVVLGEGAAFVVLETLESARRRGAPVLAEMFGYGRSADATHLTCPESEGQARAIANALDDASLVPESIDYVNAHGTGTEVGDVAETEAIKRALGAHAARVPVSSTKSAHGHLLGASGALEWAVCLAALEGGFLPATLHRDAADPRCDLDCVPHAPRRGVRVRRFLSNSFAFGGSNAVLLGGGFED